jgi:exodeoxyribonuclease VII, small subunit
VAGKKQQLSFEESLNRLEEIVRHLEKGDLPLNDSLSLYEEGTGLIAACSKMLDEAEQKVVKLKKGPDRFPVECDFEETAENES